MLRGRYPIMGTRAIPSPALCPLITEEMAENSRLMHIPRRNHCHFTYVFHTRLLYVCDRLMCLLFRRNEFMSLLLSALQLTMFPSSRNWIIQRNWMTNAWEWGYWSLESRICPLWCWFHQLAQRTTTKIMTRIRWLYHNSQSFPHPTTSSSTFF